jgi:hypothetical protein
MAVKGNGILWQVHVRRDEDQTKQREPDRKIVRERQASEPFLSTSGGYVAHDPDIEPTLKGKKEVQGKPRG